MRYVPIGIILLLILVPTVSATVQSFPCVHEKTFWSAYNLTWTPLRTNISAVTTRDIAYLTDFRTLTTSGVWWSRYKEGCTWNTSTLGSGATINSGYVTAYVWAKGAAISYGNISMIDLSPADPLSFVAGDADNTNFVKVATDIPYASINTTGSNGTNVFTLNAAGLANISKTGYTSFQFTDSANVENTEPAWAESSTFNYVLGRAISYDGGSKAMTLTVDYTAGVNMPDASFTSNVTSGQIPLSVQFNDTSTETPTSWYWDFGDGTNSTSQNPSHTYSVAAMRNVSFGATNAAGTDWYNVTNKIRANSYYFAYGDSITSNPTDTTYYLYFMQQRDPNNATHSIGRNTDGAGETITWGQTNAASHSNGTYQFVEFGTNDYAIAYYRPSIGANMESIYNYYLNNGSTPVMILFFPFNDTGANEYTKIANQVDNYTIIQNYLTSKSIPYVKAYDAIDLVPYNGVFDGWNTSNYDGGNIVHPNTAGHTAVGRYLWEWMNSPPVASFTRTNFTNNITSTGSIIVHLTDTSTNTPAAWSWTAANMTGNQTPLTVSTAKNPDITLSSPGNWSIRLTAANGAGSDQTAANTFWVNTTTPSQSLSGIQFYPTDYVLNTRIDNLPVHNYSQQWITGLGGNASTSTTYAGYYITVVGSETPHTLATAWGGGDYNSDKVAAPVPETPMVEGPNDKHLFLVDRDENKAYEFFHFTRASNGTYSCAGEYVWNLSLYRMLPDGQTSSIAAGLPMTNLLLRHDEIAAGSINHALAMQVGAVNDSTLWPGTGLVNSVYKNNTVPPYSARFRLKASKDISGFKPDSKVVAQALKTYGMIMTDNHGNGLGKFQFTAQRWNMPDGNNYFYSSSNLSDVKALTLGDFEVVDESGLIIDSSSGQTLQPPVSSILVSKTIVKVPGYINFNDTSTNSPTSWNWSYGDGQYNTTQNNTHKFTRRGVFTVTLKSTNFVGSNTTTIIVRGISGGMQELTVPEDWQYDRDLHAVLIISTIMFVILILSRKK